ncbi:uncharacterized protein FOMMEDRAFT_148803 [Fomitiporia mediterranea MF3/22]|uniref:uncharacterized protein n=1 Tax=Fomitiporia mediterranea (strain MF3/22) TaxID=694068 RepID=UPI00044072AB|nr:uncharacterized protein FOMMEDRAFT_148803 [Fomitiporia mediterranea MF3/22]EJC99296.1 hypothetical protein FOMMEDRAFT_148803 [Fomitiporia mediterranea MF3/22]
MGPNSPPQTPTAITGSSPSTKLDLHPTASAGSRDEWLPLMADGGSTPLPRDLQPRTSPRRNMRQAETNEHALDRRMHATSFNEFAQFLIRFNNETVQGVDTRFKEFETTLGEKLQRILSSEKEYERHVDTRVNLLSKTVQDGLKQVFEGERQERESRDAALVKGVADAILPALGTRLDEVVRCIKANETTTRALQNSVRSLETRLKVLEVQTRSSSTSMANSDASSSTTALSSLITPASDSNVSKRLAEQLQEFECLITRLGEYIEQARDEAHADKEELAALFEETHKNLTLTMHGELLALKNAVGVGKCRSRGSGDKHGSLRPKPRSLMERLDALAMDVQEAMEHFKDAEAARDIGDSSEARAILNILANRKKGEHGTRRVFHDTAVITNDYEHADPDANDKPGETASFVDRTVTLGPSLSEASRSGSVTPRHGSPGPALQEDEPFSATTLVGELLQPTSVVGNLSPVSSWTAPFPHQWSAPSSESPTRTGLALDTTIETPADPCDTIPTSLQVCGDDTAAESQRQLITPPPSAEASVSRSPSVTLKRKADEDITDSDEGVSQAPAEKTINDDHDLGQVDFSLDLNRSPSPLTSEDSIPAGDLAKCLSPLTSLASEISENPSVSGQSSLSDPEPEEIVLSSATAPRSASPSKRAAPQVHEEKSVQNAEERHWCPEGCGRSYTIKASLNRHLKTRCKNARRSLTTTNTRATSPISTNSSSKRRKIDHKGTKSSSRASSESRRREKQEKVEEVEPSFCHPADVLQKCDWPDKAMVNDKFDHQLLMCDRCDSSFHYRCVGVKRGDDRLIPEAEFICPPCAYIDDPENAVKGNAGNTCSRPDCDWPGEASNELEDYFIVERILGRSTVNTATSFKYVWLTKWLGYPIKECDWLEEDGLPEADKLISRFYAAAFEEKLQIRDDDAIYLLDEARSKLYLAVKMKWKWA